MKKEQQWMKKVQGARRTMRYRKGKAIPVTGCGSPVGL
jgi:hypothetical protein